VPSCCVPKNTGFMSEESIELLRWAWHTAHTDENGNGISVANRMFFQQYIDFLEKETKAFVEYYDEHTGKTCKVPIVHLIDSPAGIVVIRMNITLWSKPFLSMDMIVSRNGSPKEIISLMNETREFLVSLGCKIPMLVETPHTTILKRIFDKKVTKDFDDFAMRKLREVYIIYPVASEEEVIRDVDTMPLALTEL